MPTVAMQGTFPYPPNADSTPIRELAQDLSQLAQDLRQGSDGIRRAVEKALGQWAGEAAEAHRAHMDERARTADNVADACAEAAPILQTFAATIDATQGAYCGAVTAENAARAGLPWTSAALAAAIAMEGNIVTIGLQGAGAAQAAALALVEAKVVAAELLDVNKDQVDAVVDPILGTGKPTGDGGGTAEQGGVPVAGPPDAVGPDSFADRVRGVSSDELDVTLAQLADHVYPDTPGALPPRWSAMNPDEIAVDLGIDPATLDHRSGFTANIYAGPNGEKVVAFAGSDELTDWLHNARQGLGLNDEQYARSVALARAAAKAWGDDVVFTGHSLGGGLASAAAVATGLPAVTFNPAGLHASTMRRAGVDANAARLAAEQGIVRRYTVEHEAVSHFQEDNNSLSDWLMPDAIGARIRLDAPEPLPADGRLRYRRRMHGMDVVIGALEDQRPWATPPSPNTTDPSSGGSQ